jgi:hypothetical protein
MQRTFRDVGLLEVIGEGHVYPTVRAAVQAVGPEREEPDKLFGWPQQGTEREPMASRRSACQ